MVVLDDVLQRFRILSVEFVKIAEQSRVMWGCKLEITFFEQVHIFCYVRDMLNPESYPYGGCDTAVSLRISKGEGFKQILSTETNVACQKNWFECERKRL